MEIAITSRLTRLDHFVSPFLRSFSRQPSGWILVVPEGRLKSVGTFEVPFELPSEATSS